MLCGQYESVVDYKWRLRIPNCFARELGKELILKELKNKCIGIYCSKECFSKNEFPYIYKAKIKKGNRITIHKNLRNSNSFYFGKKVTIAGCGSHLELWPCL